MISPEPDPHAPDRLLHGDPLPVIPWSHIFSYLHARVRRDDPSLRRRYTPGLSLPSCIRQSTTPLRPASHTSYQ